MTHIIKISLLTATALIFSSCTSVSTPVVQSPSFKAGSQDVCTTANGEYTKNSASFNNDKDYKDGWFYGRKKCNPSQSR